MKSASLISIKSGHQLNSTFQALIRSNASNTNHLGGHKSIKLSTAGIIFQRGIDGVSLAALVVNIWSIFNVNSSVLRNVERNSEWLQQQCDQYLLISGDFETICSCETLPMQVG